MIGNNKIILNRDTMITAVQYWLNSEVLQNNESVSDVSYNSAMAHFEVSLAESKA